MFYPKNVARKGLNKMTDTGLACKRLCKQGLLNWRVVNEKFLANLYVRTKI